jgi:hypothetical protein
MTHAFEYGNFKADEDQFLEKKKKKLPGYKQVRSKTLYEKTITARVINGLKLLS